MKVHCGGCGVHNAYIFESLVVATLTEKAQFGVYAQCFDHSWNINRVGTLWGAYTMYLFIDHCGLQR